MGIGDPFVEQISILLAASTQGLKNRLNLVNTDSVVADFSKIDTVHTKKLVLFKQNRYCSSDLQWKKSESSRSDFFSPRNF
jgi:hypothetical protein